MAEILDICVCVLGLGFQKNLRIVYLILSKDHFNVYIGDIVVFSWPHYNYNVDQLWRNILYFGLLTLFEEESLISACVLIRTRRGEFDEVVEIIKQLKGVNRIFPVLGRYDVVVDFEAPDSLTLGNIILKMGRMAGVVFTETLVGIQHKGG